MAEHHKNHPKKYYKLHVVDTEVHSLPVACSSPTMCDVTAEGNEFLITDIEQSLTRLDKYNIDPQ